jgi:pyruvate,water dikinase
MVQHLPLEQVSLSDVALCGGKAARLGEAAHLGLTVSRSVVLPTELYRRFMRQGGLQSEIATILGTLQPSTWTHFQAAEWAIRAAFRVRRVPDILSAAILAACDAIAAPQLAIRSSATSEDSPELSFVGQHYTCMREATDRTAIVAAVLECWASLFSAKALSYAHHFGVDLLSSSMAVLLQERIAIELRGALFTADPITGNPDTFLLELADDSDPSGNPLAGIRSLDPYTAGPDEPFPVGQLRRAGLLLDERLSQYQTIEWATAGDALYILRVRPITAVPAWLPDDTDAPLNGQALALVLPCGHTPRTAQPVSWYQLSSGRADGYEAADERSADGSPTANADQFRCGYRYRGAERPASGNTTGLARMVPYVRGVLTARRLHQRLAAHQAPLRAALEQLALVDLASLSNSALGAHLARLRECRATFCKHSLALAESHAVLTGGLSDLLQRWTDGDHTAEALLGTSGVSSPHHEALCRIVRTHYAASAEQEAAFNAYYRAHRHYYLTGAPQAPDVDIATLADDEQAARLAFERCSAPESESVAVIRAREATHRDTAEHAVRAHLSPPCRWLFDRVLRTARRYTPAAIERDEPALLCLLLEHDALLEAGRRMQQHQLLPGAHDVFALTHTEVTGWLQGRESSRDLAELATERQALRRRWARYTPPLQYPPHETPSERLAATERPAIMTLTGRPICRGLVEAPAHVIRSVAEAGAVLPGQVLVCRDPLFELSPLFSLVSAVVAESGSPLDHAAVLVREYGVPAVFGVAGATERITTGEAIIVDADRGRVVRPRPTTV